MVFIGYRMFSGCRRSLVANQWSQLGLGLELELAQPMSTVVVLVSIMLMKTILLMQWRLVVEEDGAPVPVQVLEQTK